MKSITKMIFVAVVAIFLIPNFSFAWQGSGTASVPYEIWNKDDLQALADTVNNHTQYYTAYGDLHFKLMADITDTFRTVIGHNNPAIIHRWNNHFDGNGHKIVVSITQNSNLGTWFLGLFGFADNYSVIENLTVEGIVSGIAEVGGICGMNYGLIQNCTNYVSVTSIGGWSGGICGDNWGEILHCVNLGSVKSNFLYIGGICGINRGNISYCINVGNIKETDEVGGIVGRNSIAGSSSNSLNILENNLNIGTVEGQNIVGGIVACIAWNINNNDIKNNVNAGFVKGNDAVGGIIGAVSVSTNSTISNNFNSGVVSGETNWGCIIGLNLGTVTLINNHYDKQMCGEPEPSELGE